MLLTITTTHKPATDLGYLLHKSPFRVHSTELSAGRAHVFYPEATEERCTAALLVDIDTIDLVRRKEGTHYPLEQYVNDRPYAASSQMSVALARIFSTAMSGISKDRQELADQKLPFEVYLPTLPCRGGEPFLRQLFEPLGYLVSAQPLQLDPNFPEWGNSEYFRVTLSATVRLKDMLTHLNVLIPVLDNNKHYWVGDDEIEKLFRRGEGWLRQHPMVEEITRRYLKNQRSLAREALQQLLHEEEPNLDRHDSEVAHSEEVLEEKISLNEQRLNAVVEAIRASDATSVVDLGCGEGNLLRKLIGEKNIKRIVGVDVSLRSLEQASRRIGLEDGNERLAERVALMHGSLIYRDKRIEGFDAAAVIEVIEHLEADRLSALERVVFKFAKPKTVVVSTPNSEYNVKFEDLPHGKLRHPDHRFEWTRGEFSDWCNKIKSTYGYAFDLHPIGPVDPAVGSPTQMAVFKR